LREKFIPKFEGAQHVNRGQGGNKMLLESGDCRFRGIGAMVVQGVKLTIHLLGANMCFGGLGALIVHDVEGWVVHACRTVKILVKAGMKDALIWDCMGRTMMAFRS
jgi:hypothetical protein